MLKRKLRLFSCLLITLLLSGCWDVINIEERGFIMGMAIDLTENGNTGGKHLLTLTSQFAVPPGLGTPSQGGGGASSPFMNFSVSGDSLYAMAQELSDQTSKIPFFEHLKVVIVSEEVAAQPELFADVMDVFIRNRDTRRGIKVILAKGKAKDILNIQPVSEKLPARYIDKLLENSLTKTGEMKAIRIGDIHEYLLSKANFVLSEVVPEQTKIKSEGGSVYSGNLKRFIGRLDRKEMLALNLITGESVRAPIEVNRNNHVIAFSIERAASKIKINTENPESMNITVVIKLEGELQETFGTAPLQTPAEFRELENEISKKVEKMANLTVEKAQKDFETDIFSFADNLEKFHYDTWKKIKDNWDHGENYFSKSNIRVKVKTEVRLDGVVNETKK